jgi:hypothetical protein
VAYTPLARPSPGLIRPRIDYTYVSNIYKYYVAYALVQGEYLERMEARQQFMSQK